MSDYKTFEHKNNKGTIKPIDNKKYDYIGDAKIDGVMYTICGYKNERPITTGENAGGIFRWLGLSFIKKTDDSSSHKPSQQKSNVEIQNVVESDLPF